MVDGGIVYRCQNTLSLDKGIAGMRAYQVDSALWSDCSSLMAWRSRSQDLKQDKRKRIMEQQASFFVVEGIVMDLWENC
jgi:hypothetical protein